MGRLLLVTGGAGSGKSRYALQRALPHGPTLYVATAAITDPEMAARVQRHVDERPPEWSTLEARYDLAPAIEARRREQSCVLLEDVGTLVGNLLIERAADQPAVDAEVDALAALARGSDVELIVVTQEVGMGIVPATESGRRFRDLLGRANQRLASQSQEVVLVVAGLPLTLKS
jgi:adenosylcobinamide kinase/adenosylcobinamide-phosphate guanylyltransferase